MNKEGCSWWSEGRREVIPPPGAEPTSKTWFTQQSQVQACSKWLLFQLCGKRKMNNYAQSKARITTNGLKLQRLKTDTAVLMKDPGELSFIETSYRMILVLAQHTLFFSRLMTTEVLLRISWKCQRWDRKVLQSLRQKKMKSCNRLFTIEEKQPLPRLIIALTVIPFLRRRQAMRHRTRRDSKHLKR